MQYLNAKFPLEYVYSGAHGAIPNLPKPGEGNVHAPKTKQKKGRQSTDVLVFFCFVFLLFFFVVLFFCCFFCCFFLLLVNFYSLGLREDTANPESEFGIFFPL